MIARLDEYAGVAGQDVVNQLRQLAETIQGIRVVHVNSTREGGGVAEILSRLVPLMQELGVETSWEVLSGDPSFYACTKSIHNALQGDSIEIPDAAWDSYESVNRTQAEVLREKIEEADMVFVHDPQPAALISHFPNRTGRWIWRCHIDVSRPFRPVWKRLRRTVQEYDASIWHTPSFAQPVGHPQYLIPPSIDPMSEKNIELNSNELQSTYRRFNLDPERPIILQVSRFDRFKDPIGVIHSYRLARRFIPLQLVLAGGGASDDPEGQVVLDQVRNAASGDPDIHILLLPSDAHRTINALQRIADIVLQKSLK